MSDDIRWQQRFDNYVRALAQLQAAVSLSQTRPLSELEQQGLIQAFEFTHELAWNVMKDYFAYQGQTNIMGSRDATRAAFAVQLIEDGEGWMEMIASRNQSSHTYNRATADALAGRITQTYAALFARFATKMDGLRGG
ncbi:MAG: nucleotidyltransferase substrate binding protein [Leptothrix sp. (in: b-proteobacteria)]